MRRLVTLVAGLCVLASVAAVPAAASGTQTGQNCAFPVTLTDATGTEVTLEERPERVTTTNPSAAQTMWEIGGRDQVVGLTRYASYLEGSESRANVSASFGISVERVAGTNPDLVVAPNATGPEEVAALRRAGLTVYLLREPTDIAGISEATRTIGQLTGNCEGAAEANAWMEANVEAVRNVSDGATERPAALYPLGGGFVAGGDTFIDVLLAVAGADNAAAEYDGYPELSNEALVELDPEVLVVTERTAGYAGQEPYASTTAGERNATVRLRVRDLNQAAPRSVVNSVHNASRQLYPDRYDDSIYVPRSAVRNVTGDQPTAGATTDTSPATTSGGSGPGFTAVSALVGALVAALLVARRDR